MITLLSSIPLSTNYKLAALYSVQYHKYRKTNIKVNTMHTYNTTHPFVFNAKSSSFSDPSFGVYNTQFTLLKSYRQTGRFHGRRCGIGVF